MSLLTPSPETQTDRAAAVAVVLDSHTVAGIVTIRHPKAGERQYPAVVRCQFPRWMPPYYWSVQGVPRPLRNAALNAFGDAADEAVQVERMQSGGVVR